MVLVNTSAKAATELFGEEAKDGQRVIDSNGKRIGINQQGDVLIAKVPEVQAASEYQRLSQGSNLISLLYTGEAGSSSCTERKLTVSQVCLI